MITAATTGIYVAAWPDMVIDPSSLATVVGGAFGFHARPTGNLGTIVGPTILGGFPVRPSDVARWQERGAAVYRIGTGRDGMQVNHYMDGEWEVVYRSGRFLDDNAMRAQLRSMKGTL